MNRRNDGSSIKGFVADFQSDNKTVLYERPTTATSEYFKGKYVKVDGTPTLIDNNTADLDLKKVGSQS